MIRTFLFILSFLFISSADAQIEKELPTRPSPARLVNDLTNTLSADQTQALENKLVQFDDSTSNQIAVVIVPTTGDYDVSDYATALGRAWGVGNKKTNNGVVILVAKNDRKIFIATGYGLEGALPDVTCKHIIENEIKPNFRENDFYRGLDEGTDAIMSATKGEYKVPADYGSRKGSKGGKGNLIVFVLIVIFLLFIKPRGGGGGGFYNRRGFFFMPPLGGGGGWSSGGGSDSGGFGGFGGGSFGGGGSGGSW